MIPRFGRAVPQLSMISKRIADIIFDDYGHLRRDLVQPWLSQAELKQFADSIGVLSMEQFGHSANRA